jgi:hypothetical protein
MARPCYEVDLWSSSIAMHLLLPNVSCSQTRARPITMSSGFVKEASVFRRNADMDNVSNLTFVSAPEVTFESDIPTKSVGRSKSSQRHCHDPAV